MWVCNFVFFSFLFFHDIKAVTFNEWTMKQVDAREIESWRDCVLGTYYLITVVGNHNTCVFSCPISWLSPQMDVHSVVQFPSDELQDNLICTTRQFFELENEDEDVRRVSKKQNLIEEDEEGTSRSTSNSALRLRDKTAHNLRKQAEKMIERGEGILPPLQVGDSVHIELTSLYHISSLILTLF